jgi:hypothetical protein
MAAVELSEQTLVAVRSIISSEFPIGADPYEGIRAENIAGITYVKADGPGNLVALARILETPGLTDTQKDDYEEFYKRIRPILIIVMYLIDGSIIQFTCDFDDEVTKKALVVDGEDRSVREFKAYFLYKSEVMNGSWKSLFNIEGNSLERQELFGRIICQIVGQFVDTGAIAMWKHRAGGSRKPKTRTNRKKRQPSNRKKRQSRKRQARK